MNKRGTLWITDIAEIPFYEEIKTDDELHIGQFCSAPSIHYPWFPPKVLTLEKYNSINETNSTFKIENYNPGYHNPIPLKFLNLRVNEMLFIFKGKVRTVIPICFHSENTWFISNQSEGSLATCLPVFSFKERHPQKFIMKVQAFLFPNLFYIQPDNMGATKEGAVRFELIQTVYKKELKPCKNTHNKPFKLSSYILKLLWFQLNSFFGIKPLEESLIKDIKDYQSIIIDEIERI